MRLLLTTSIVVGLCVAVVSCGRGAAGSDDVTATTAGFDYESTSGTLTFNPGELSKTVVVRVFVDTDFEGAETFSVTLSQPTNVTIAKATGIGTILNDDEETSISIDDASVA